MVKIRVERIRMLGIIMIKYSWLQSDQEIKISPKRSWIGLSKLRTSIPGFSCRFFDQKAYSFIPVIPENDHIMR